MTLKEWLDKHDIREMTAVRKLQELVGEKGCTEYAVRKWITGERIPRPKMQATIMQFTTGAVTPNDWVLFPMLSTKKDKKTKSKKSTKSTKSTKRNNHR